MVIIGGVMESSMSNTWGLDSYKPTVETVTGNTSSCLMDAVVLL